MHNNSEIFDIFCILYYNIVEAKMDMRTILIGVFLYGMFN